MSKKEWHKVPNANRWQTSLGADWSLAIARSPTGGWRVVNSPGDGSFSTTLDCEDDLETAQLAAIEIVAERARSMIDTGKAILAATGVM